MSSVGDAYGSQRPEMARASLVLNSIPRSQTPLCAAAPLNGNTFTGARKPQLIHSAIKTRCTVMVSLMSVSLYFLTLNSLGSIQSNSSTVRFVCLAAIQCPRSQKRVHSTVLRSDNSPIVGQLGLQACNFRLAVEPGPAGPG